MGNGDPPTPTSTKGNDDNDSSLGEETQEKETIPPPPTMLDGSFAIEDMAVALSQLLESEDNPEEPWMQCKPVRPLWELRNGSNAKEESKEEKASTPIKQKSTDRLLHHHEPSNTKSKPRSSKRIEQKKIAAKAKTKTTPKHIIQTKDSVLTTPKKSSEAGGRHEE